MAGGELVRAPPMRCAPGVRQTSSKSLKGGPTISLFRQAISTFSSKADVQEHQAQVRPTTRSELLGV